jgi:aspartyl-tRNA(Asn)/glutamyl-tRNA(Gln) amidotransferase subunit C
MISKKDIRHIAKLAKLKLKEGEIEKFQKELSEILEYVEKLNEVDVREIEPKSYSMWLEKTMRKDEEKKSFDYKKEELIEQFSQKERNFLKVKKII